MFMKKYYLFILSLLCIGFITANAAETVTFDFTKSDTWGITAGQSTGKLTAGKTLEIDPVVFTLTKLTDTSNLACFYSDGLRIYGNNSAFTVSIPENIGKITNIAFTFGKKNGGLNASYSYDGTTSETFTIESQARLATMVVTYEEAVSDTQVPTPSISLAGGMYNVCEKTDNIELTCSDASADILYNTEAEDAANWTKYTDPFTLTSDTEKDITLYVKATDPTNVKTDSKVVSEIYSFVAQKTFVQVTNAQQLSAGKKILLGYIDDDGNLVPMINEFANGVYKAGTPLTITDGMVAASEKAVTTITLGGESTAWTLYDNVQQGYIVPGSSHQLSMAATAGDITWKITADGVNTYNIHASTTSSRSLSWSSNSKYLNFANNTKSATTTKLLCIFIEHDASKVVTPLIKLNLMPNHDGSYYFGEEPTVTLESATTDAAIEYNFTSAEATEWTSYTEPFTVKESCTLYARASKDGLETSDVASMTFNFINEPLLAPTATPANAPVESDDATLTYTYYIGGEGTGVITLKCETSESSVEYNTTSAEATEWTEAATFEGFTTDGTLYIRSRKNASYSDVVTYTYKFVEKPASTTYVLVTDASQLVAGKKYLIANNDAQVTLGTQSTSNIKATSIKIANNSIELEDGAAVMVLTLGGTEGAWTLHHDGGYLYAVGSSDNSLKSQETVNANGQWSIAVTEAGVATMKAQCTGTRNWLRYNSSYKLFSCYASGQADISLYVEYTPTETIETETGLDAVILGETDKAYKINTPIIGRYYDSASKVLFASTESSKATSCRYTEPTTEQAEHYYSDKLDKMDQGDWVALTGEGLDAYLNKELSGVIGVKTADSPYPTLSISSMNEETQDVQAYTPNLYKVANFDRQKENTKGLWLVKPLAGEYCQVSGMVMKGDENDKTKMSDMYSNNEGDNEMSVDLSRLSDTDFNAIEDLEWYVVTGIVTTDAEGKYVLVALSAKDATATSVEGVEAAAINAYGVAGAIVVSANGAVEVYNMAGVKVAAAQVDGTMAITAAPGVYVVKAGTQTVKVAVK